MNSPKNLINRQSALLNELKKNKVSACIIQDPVNLFYYCGMHISTGILVFTEKKRYLIVDPRYAERCKKLAPFEVINTMDFKKSLKDLNFKNTFALDSQVTNLSSYELYKSFFKLKSLPGFLAKVRMKKDPSEIKAISYSCDIVKRGLKYIQRHFKEGVTELEIKTKLEQFFLKEGAEKCSFDSIIAFGKNSANPHYFPTNQKLKKNDIILIDCGAVYKNYCSDSTRTFIFGKPPKRLLEIYNLVDEISKEIISLCVPGAKPYELTEKTKEFFAKHNVKDLFIHSLGHGVGIEVHEEPFYKDKDLKLEPGMVIAIEPGLYIDGLGGVRIEDSLLITPKGNKNLTR